MAQTKAQLVVGLNVNASAPASALQIDASGNVNLDSNTLYVDATNNRVGVGTTSPSRTLHVNGDIRVDVGTSNTTALYIPKGYINGDSAGATGPFAIGNYGDSSSEMRIATRGFTTFYRGATDNNSGTESVRIDSSGRVGIGTSSPGSLLTVKSPGAATTFFNCENSSGTSILRLFQTAGGSGRLIVSDSTGTDFFNVQADQGRVGIGTTSPVCPLHVSNGGANGIEFFTDAPSGSSTINSYNRSSSLFTSLTTNAAQHIFLTSSTERARIDSSGRLLVGTSSARGNFFNSSTAFPQLQIEGTNGNTCSLVSVSSAADTDGGRLLLAHQRSGSIGGNTILNNGDEIGRITFQGSDGSEFVNAVQITAEVDGTPGANDMPGRLVFSTTADGASSPTNRMRISAFGRIDTFDSSGVCIQATSALAAGTSNYIFIGRYAGTQLDSGVACYAIYTNGSFQQLSDANLKKNIETTRDGYLEDLNKLRVVKYNWKDQQEGAAKELGLIAQEVEEVFPGLVAEMDAESEYANKGIKTSVLPYMTIKALQEATERIKQLEAEMAAVKAQLS